MNLDPKSSWFHSITSVSLCGGHRIVAHSEDQIHYTGNDLQGQYVDPHSTECDIVTLKVHFIT